MIYKMIAVDLDDTLLDNDLSISPINKQAIAEAAKRGVKVVISTGRMFVSTLPYAKELNLNLPVITYQGALIKDIVSDKVMLSRPVPIDIAKEIINESRKFGVHIQVYLGDDYYFDSHNGYSKLYYDLSGIEGKAVDCLETFLTQEPIKILIMDSPEKIADLTEHFTRLFGDKVEITISKSSYLEFTNITASKGTAVAFLAETYNIKKEEIIAIGDGYNDISMIQYAGLGVAMGNAPQAVKEIADFVTLPHYENGVAHCISKFVLEGERL